MLKKKWEKCLVLKEYGVDIIQNRSDKMDDKYCGNCKHFNGSGGYVVTCCDVNRPWFCCYSNTVACENYEKVKDKMEEL